MSSVIEQLAREPEWVVVGGQERLGIPFLRTEMRRDLRSHARALRGVLSVRRRDEDHVHVHLILLRPLAVAALLAAPAKLHEPASKAHHLPLSYRDTVAR